MQVDGHIDFGKLFIFRISSYYNFPDMVGVSAGTCCINKVLLPIRQYVNNIKRISPSPSKFNPAKISKQNLPKKKTVEVIK